MPGGLPLAANGGASGLPDLAGLLAAKGIDLAGLLAAKGMDLSALLKGQPNLLSKAPPLPPLPGAGLQPLGSGMPGLLGLPSPPGLQGLSPMPAITGDGKSAPSEPVDPFMSAVRDFLKRWDIEKRFEPKLVSYLSRKGDQWQAELDRLHKELVEAGVPPVCRSGYLLVVFGDVNEKSTDEDFRVLLTGKTGDGSSHGIDSSPEREDPVEVPAARPGPPPGERKAAPLPEDWMMDEVNDLCAKHKLDDQIKNRFIEAMRHRESTFKYDLRTLRDVLRGAKHPKGALSLKLREMERGTFQPRCWTPSPDRGGPDPPRGGSRDRGRSRDRRGGSRPRRDERGKGGGGGES